MFYLSLNWLLIRLVSFFPLFFPLYLLKVNFEIASFSVPSNFLEIFTIFVFIIFLIRELIELFKEESAWLILKASFKNFFKVRGKNHWNSIAVPVCLLLLGSVVGVFVAPDFRLALGVFKGWIFFPLLYFLMWRSVLDDNSWIRITIHSFFASATILAFWALFQVYSGNYLTVDMRASGPFESANYLAMYLGPAVAMQLALIFRKFEKKISWGWESFFLLCETLICGLALFFSYSYASFIAVFCGFSFYLILRFGFSLLKLWKKVFLFAVLFFSALVLLLYLAQGNSSKFKDFLDFENNSSSSVRLELWTVALNFAFEKPIIGIGLGQFQEMYVNNAERILGKKPFDPKVLHPHNIYLSFWLYTGAFGIFSLFWIVMSCLVRIKYCLPYLRGYMRLGLVMLAVILVHGLFDNTFWKNDLAYIFWFAVALSRI